MAAAAQRVTIQSLNVLADCYVRIPGCPWTNFEHCSEDALAWSARLPRLQALLRESNADIICLQEVQFEHAVCPPGVPSWASEALAAHYVGVMQDDTKRAATQRTGNATFFRASMFEQSAAADHRSRSLTLWLQRKGDENSVFAVANCHLEGNPDKGSERIAQLRSVQRCIESKAKTTLPHATRAVICGDFNSELEGTPLAAVALARCGAADGHADGHASDGAAWCNAIGTAAPPTWFAPGCSLTLDHVLFCDNGLAAEPHHAACDAAALSARGLPDAQHPSDHLPVIVSLRITKWKHVAAACAGGEELSAEDAAALECQWRRLSACAPEKPQGKPSAEQMAALRDHAAKMKAWMATLTPAAAEHAKRLAKSK
jgi:endonuclease/exonuclease/phosphatase family metal-dependent hydrolase